MPYSFVNSLVIVDDSLFIRKQLSNILEKNHFKVSASLTNNTAALALCRKLHPKLVIIDLDMPEMNSIGTIQQLLNEEQNIKIIAMSALGKQHLIKKALLIGAKDYIVKPLKESQILTTFNRLGYHSLFSQNFDLGFKLGVEKI